ncbi:MAG: hypothetical protein JJD93_08615, partial [Ilumatobacteraceae bacterium]|nr:hypothetical protein [Ilumatobacteraceae bacterium]
PSGLTAWGFGVGPAAFDLGGPVLRPFIRGGREGTSGWATSLGLALDDLSPTTNAHKELFARWRESEGLSVVARSRVSGADHDDSEAAAVALFAADAVLELLGNYVIAINEVDAILNKLVNGNSVRSLLQGSILSSADDHAIATSPVSSLPGSLFVLARKLAGALPAVPLGPIEVGLHLDGDLVGLRVNIIDANAGLVLNPQGDTVIAIVTDSHWIESPTPPSPPPPGVVVDLLTITAGTSPAVTVTPSFAANGLGVKITKSSGPLLDAGLRLDGVAVHLFGKLVPDGATVAVSGGVHLELIGLGVPLGSGGGDNAVAKGVMNDAGGSGAPPTPKFSPAIAVQAHHGVNGVAVSLAAGPGDGPWYLPIQRAFGPVYIEQVGLGTGYTGSAPRHLAWISVSLDGSVSLFGISASVDKLRLTYHVNKPFFDIHSWSVDLDGFAISSSIGGLTLAGALLRADLAAPLKGVEYLGMLKIGFNGYGIDLFGGYANPDDGNGTFASFFAFGALHAPLGGVPAFFITGVGIGFGINRELKPPSMETITANPFLVAMKALGPAPEPKEQLKQMGANIGPKRGEYWVAAGISFTSFVLISGEIVVTVAFGDGLEITVLGLARAELPTPVAKLVSIELALLARFSTKEGVVLVQAQLTENSWLLTESVRLTGGFAFATWWKGPNAGQFVVTMGGYHPKFHKSGYPVVPRLGLRWQPIENISIVGESYFALCSEALMAGTKLEVSAHFGPAHARLSFGADGIVFFDPFWFEVTAWAEISAGIKIWLLFGTVNIELSLGASVTITGPPIHVEGRFEICGFEVPFEFGDEKDPNDARLTAAEFRDKYLRASADAQMLQASVVLGGVAAGKKSDGSPQKVPDGSPLNPFLVVPEFQLVLITTAPAVDMKLSGSDGSSVTQHVSAPDLGVAPMSSPSLQSNLHAEISKIVKTGDPAQPVSVNGISMTPRANASFPKGVWGEPQNKKAPKVPAGETIDASDGFTFSTVLADKPPTPAVDYHQIELPFAGRKPLPFVSNRTFTNQRAVAVKALQDMATAIRPADGDLDARFNVAARLLDAGGYGTIGVAALRGERASAPSFGSLADDLVVAPKPESPKVDAVVVDRTKVARAFVGPMVKAVMAAPLSTVGATAPITTVKDPGNAIARPAPSIDSMRGAVSRLAPASLLVRSASVQTVGRRVIAAVGVSPVTRLATSPIGAVVNARPDRAASDRLAQLTGDLGDGARQGAVVHEGEVVVIAIASRATSEHTDVLNVNGGPCRVVALAAGGSVLFD